MDLAAKAHRGEKARLLLENELYKEAWTSLHDGILHAWENAPIRDKEGQNELKLMLKLLNDVRRNLEDIMQTGKLASIQIERETWKDRIKDKFK